MSKVELPDVPGAYMDNERRVWLLELDPPSKTGLWRIPGGTLAKPGSTVLNISLERMGVESFRRMVPVAGNWRKQPTGRPVRGSR